MEPGRMSAVILAGGKSSRMGQNKLFLPLGGRPVVEHFIDLAVKMFAECIVVTDEPNSFSRFPVKVTHDLVADGRKNALAGIHAGLLAAAHAYVFVAAGDMPFITPEVIRLLCSLADGYDLVVPREGPHYQPLCAVYHKRCLPAIVRQLAARRLRVAQFFPQVHVREVESRDMRAADPEGIAFFNVNTPEDYATAKALYARLTVQRGGESWIYRQSPL
ncbi:MAG TPA: molybdenum cofactor guanylyltransferase [Firmicutes bacterium]|nr:molybdenum cofactor guanylyltransferase [Bacillota bacterium]